MGCRIERSPDVKGEAYAPYTVRFLINPDNGGTANLGVLRDDEPVFPDEVRGWERDLDCVIPKPWDGF